MGAAAELERVLIQGDLAKLSPEQKVQYYTSVCDALGLNPLTRPFEYITLNNKLVLYARKDATDQLRKLHSISIGEPTIRFEDDWIIVTTSAKTPDGRTDADVGVVSRKDMRGDFGNALMKAVTKSKRRVTLSIVGLGVLDETEVEAIPDARPHAEPEPPKALPAKADDPVEAGRRVLDTAKTVAELANAWRSLAEPVQAQLVQHKDARKAALAPAEAPSPDRALQLIADLRELVEPGDLDAFLRPYGVALADYGRKVPTLKPGSLSELIAALRGWKRREEPPLTEDGKLPGMGQQAGAPVH